MNVNDNESEMDSAVLGEYLRRQRLALGLGLRPLARQAGLDATWIMRLERGEYTKPDPRRLVKLAAALGLEVNDVYMAVGYSPGYVLPGLAPYLRAKYDLPPAAIRQLEDHFELINERYLREQEGGSHDDHRLAA